MKNTYIDLFAGCGGLSLGLHNAGWKGVFAIEKSKDAFETLRYNLIEKKDHFKWPDWLPKKNLNINTVIDRYELQLTGLQGKVDMVTGGPPCQGFSTAGKRKESDARNKLIDSYVKFIKLVKPKVLFFENVKGFTLEFEKNAQKGKKYSDYVINELDKIGYEVNANLVNFADYGVPQKRCRFILVGIRKDIAKVNKLTAESFFSKLKKNKEKFLVSKNLEVKVTLEQAISDLLRVNGVKDSEEYPRFKMGLYGNVTSKYQAYLRKNIVCINPDSHRFANHSLVIQDRFQKIIDHSIPGRNLSDQEKAAFNTKKRNIFLLNRKDQTPTITTLPDDYIHYNENRILTVREYARIQSFPDDYVFLGKYTTGGKRRKVEVPRYTQIGNAIPPLFGEQSGNVLKSFV